MSNSNSHNNQFTTDDIRRYVEGRMSPAEMHKIELAALEDPFLADAIEGMRLSYKKYGSASFGAGVDDLKNRLQNKRRKRNIGMAWRVAAVLMVMVTGIALTYLLQRSDRNESSTMSQVTTIPPAPRADSLAEVPEQKTTTDSVLQNKNIQAQKRSFVKKPDTPKNEEPAKPQPSDVTDKEMEEVVVSEAPIAIERDTQAFRKYEASANAKSQETMQSLEGRTADIAVNPSKNTAAFTSSVFEPEGGWPDFHEYITKNKNIPDSVSALHGITRFTFTIDAAGRPIDIKFKKALTPAHTSEVIRLLQNGPRWKVLKGNKRRVELPLNF